MKFSFLPHCWPVTALVVASASVAHAQAATAPDKTIVALDVASAKTRDATKGRISGTLAAPWNDNSEWAKVSVKYDVTTEDNRKFQRAQVTELETGRAQLAINLPKATETKLYSFEMTARASKDLPVTLGVRELGPPYKWPWQVTPKLSADWQDFSYTFELPAADAPTGIYILIDGVGTLDIARLSLKETTAEAMRAQMEAQLPQNGARNLLRQTRFPLGLQSGWWLNPTGAATGIDAAPRATSDAQTIGPSGFSALKIEAPQPFQLYAAPFALPVPFEKHVASFSLKGTGTGAEIILADGKEIARQNFDLKDADWTRQQIAFTPDPLAKIYAMRLNSSAGTLWLDATQVEMGAKATPYAPQMASEISLAGVGSDDVNAPSASAFTNIQFAEQPAQIEFCATGAPAGSALSVSVTDVYGREKKLSNFALNGDKSQKGRVNYADLAQLGAFRVEAQIVDAGGVAVSAPAEIVMNRMRRPRYWNGDAPDSPFGVHTLPTERNLVMAKAMGLNWARLHDAGLDLIGWKYLEPEKSKWQFRDAEIQRYRAHKIKLLGTLSTAPEWASYQQDTPRKGKNAYHDQFFQPKNLADYANYVSVVTKRYQGTIDAYEVGNEPWSREWWAVDWVPAATDREGYRTSANPQRDFAAMMKTAFDAAKAVDPKLTIVGFNTSAAPENTEAHINGKDWTQGVMENGGLNSSDVISYHQYPSTQPGYPGDEVERGVATATGPLVENGKLPRPLWLSEGGAVNNIPRYIGMYRLTAPNLDAENSALQADRLMRFQVALLSQNVSKIFLYSMHAHNFFGVKDKWSLLVNADNSLNPAGVAQSNLAWQLEDTKFSKRIEVAPGVYAYLFQNTKGAARAVAVLARQKNSPYNLPRAATVSSVDLWGNAVAGGTELGESLVYVSAAGDVAAMEKLLK